MRDRIASAAVLAMSLLICLPFVHFVSWLGDEGVMLNAAQRMLRGEALYRDFFEFQFPLGFWLTAGWMRLCGQSLVAVRILAIITIVLSALFAYRMTRSLSQSPGAAAFLVLLWLLSSQGSWTVINHRWFALLFAVAGLDCAGATLAVTYRPSGWFWAGLLVAASVMTTPPPGLLAGLACLPLLIRRQRGWAELAAFVVGGLLVGILTLAGLVHTQTLRPMLVSGVGFLIHRYSDIQAVRFGYGMQTQSVPLALFFPLLLVLVVGTFLGEQRPWVTSISGRAALAWAAMGFAMCFPRADVAHIAFAVPLGCPLGALFCRRAIGWSRPARLATLLGAGGLLAVALGGYIDKVVDTMAQPTVALRPGTLRLGAGTSPAALLPLLEAIEAERSDAGFFYPYDAMLTYIAQRRHVAPVEYFTPGFTWPEQYRQSCEIVLKQADWVVLDREAMNPQVMGSWWPRIGNVNPPERVGFEAAIESSFDPVFRSKRFELRRRRHDTNLDRCRSIARGS
jgi:hypothetical protein